MNTLPRIDVKAKEIAEKNSGLRCWRSLLSLSRRCPSRNVGGAELQRHSKDHKEPQLSESSSEDHSQTQLGPQALFAFSFHLHSCNRFSFFNTHHLFRCCRSLCFQSSLFLAALRHFLRLLLFSAKLRLLVLVLPLPILAISILRDFQHPAVLLQILCQELAVLNFP